MKTFFTKLIILFLCVGIFQNIYAAQPPKTTLRQVITNNRTTKILTVVTKSGTELVATMVINWGLGQQPEGELTLPDGAKAAVKFVNGKYTLKLGDWCVNYSLNMHGPSILNTWVVDSEHVTYEKISGDMDHITRVTFKYDQEGKAVKNKDDKFETREVVESYSGKLKRFLGYTVIPAREVSELTDGFIEEMVLQSGDKFLIRGVLDKVRVFPSYDDMASLSVVVANKVKSDVLKGYIKVTDMAPIEKNTAYRTFSKDMRFYAAGVLVVGGLADNIMLSDLDYQDKIQKLETLKSFIIEQFTESGSRSLLEPAIKNTDTPSELFYALGHIQNLMNGMKQEITKYRLSGASLPKVQMMVVDEFIKNNAVGNEQTYTKRFIDDGWLEELISMGEKEKANKVINNILANKDFVFTKDQRDIFAAAVSKLDYALGGVLHVDSKFYYKMADKGLTEYFSDQGTTVFKFPVDYWTQWVDDHIELRVIKKHIGNLKEILNSLIDQKTSNLASGLFNAYNALGRINRAEYLVNHPEEIPDKKTDKDVDARYESLLEYANDLIEKTNDNSLNKTDAERLIDRGQLYSFIEVGLVDEAKTIIRSILKNKLVSTTEQRDKLAGITAGEDFDSGTITFSTSMGQRVRTTIAGISTWSMLFGFGLTPPLEAVVGGKEKLLLNSLLDKAENEQNPVIQYSQYAAIRKLIFWVFFQPDSPTPTMLIYTTLGRANQALAEKKNIEIEPDGSPNFVLKDKTEIITEEPPKKGVFVEYRHRDYDGVTTGLNLRYGDKTAVVRFEYGTTPVRMIPFVKTFVTPPGKTKEIYLGQVNKDPHRNAADIIKLEYFVPLTVKLAFDFDTKEIVQMYSDFWNNGDVSKWQKWIGVRYGTNSERVWYKDDTHITKANGTKTDITYYEDGSIKQVVVRNYNPEFNDGRPWDNTTTLYYPGNNEVNDKMIKARLVTSNHLLQSLYIRDAAQKNGLKVYYSISPDGTYPYETGTIDPSGKINHVVGSGIFTALPSGVGIDNYLDFPEIKPHADALINGTVIDDTEELAPKENKLLAEALQYIEPEGPVIRVSEIYVEAYSNNSPQRPKKVVAMYDTKTTAIYINYEIKGNKINNITMLRDPHGNTSYTPAAMYEGSAATALVPFKIDDVDHMIVFDFQLNSSDILKLSSSFTSNKVTEGFENKTYTGYYDDKGDLTGVDVNALETSGNQYELLRSVLLYPNGKIKAVMELNLSTNYLESFVVYDEKGSVIASGKADNILSMVRPGQPLENGGYIKELVYYIEKEIKTTVKKEVTATSQIDPKELPY
ncbi:MAG: hypothetical protein V1647_00085, partial [Pseudomonadota bacterium]